MLGIRRGSFELVLWLPNESALLFITKFHRSLETSQNYSPRGWINPPQIAPNRRDVASTSLLLLRRPRPFWDQSAARRLRWFSWWFRTSSPTARSNVSCWYAQIAGCKEVDQTLFLDTTREINCASHPNLGDDVAGGWRCVSQRFCEFQLSNHFAKTEHRWLTISTLVDKYLGGEKCTFGIRLR